MIGTLLRSRASGVGGRTHADQAPPQLELVAYAADCRVRGLLGLRDSRLSDMLNKRSEIRLTKVTATSIVGGPDLELREITLWRDDLYAIQLDGPRGDRDKRRPGASIPLGIKLGPYLVHGNIHAAPGADPIETFRRGRSMVPLTDAWIEHRRKGDQAGRDRLTALLVNRLLVDWVTLAPEEEQDQPDEGAAATGESIDSAL